MKLKLKLPSVFKRAKKTTDSMARRSKLIDRFNNMFGRKDSIGTADLIDQIQQLRWDKAITQVQQDRLNKALAAANQQANSTAMSMSIGGAAGGAASSPYSSPNTPGPFYPGGGSAPWPPMQSIPQGGGGSTGTWSVVGGQAIYFSPGGDPVLSTSNSDYVDIVESSMAEEVKNIPKKVDLKELDKLIVTPEKRRSIIAVMKQHLHSDKIFNTWGLGDVMEYGRGMTMLFHGPPGTGKTWAATCIARAMGKDILVMENGKLQSSEPGGMERAVQQAFAQAKKGRGKVLFFDECDSLLSTRNNAGMIMASHINALLTEIEQFEGVCILATNRIGELDEALERRISLIVKFPKPGLEQRKLIWERFLPKKLPLHKDVDLEELYQHEIAGGLIKNVVLNAARTAVADDREKICMEDFRLAFKQVERGEKAFETPSVAPTTHGYAVGRNGGYEIKDGEYETEESVAYRRAKSNLGPTSV